MSEVLDIAKGLSVRQNVSFRVLDSKTGKVIQEHVGHNSATNSLLVGIGHYLAGEGVLNQAAYMLGSYIPMYISLGTMGLRSQAYKVLDDKKVPSDIGLPGYDYNTNDYGIETIYNTDDPYHPVKYVVTRYNSSTGQYVELPYAVFSTRSEAQQYIGTASARARYDDYLYQSPGFGADGSYPTHNNERNQLGLGAPATLHDNVNKELISSHFLRVPISYREVLPAHESEQAESIDIVYSALISTGALSSFREYGHDYLFITEAGLWSRRDYDTSGCNGLLAGYRIKLPDDAKNQRMDLEANRQALEKEILCVGVNQVVQVIWKIQLGTSERFGKTVSVEPPFPYGTIDIFTNGVHDVSMYADANVQVPQPSGKITITQNANDINIAQYATADVDVHDRPEKGVIFSDWDSDGYPATAEIVGFTVIPIRYLGSAVASTPLVDFTRKLTKVIIGEGTKTIANNLLCSRRSVTTAITEIILPTTLTYIQGDVIWGTFDEIVIPNVDPITLGGYSFRQSSVEKLVIYGGITDSWYAQIGGIKQFICYGQIAQWRYQTIWPSTPVELYDFSGCTNLFTLSSISDLPHADGCIIKVKQSMLSQWQAATNWCDLPTDSSQSGYVVWQGV